MSSRYLHRELVKHLVGHRQMIFLVGPRQVGKTTMARSLLKRVRAGRNYFNWDLREHRRLVTGLFYGSERQLLQEESPIVFDEIHKYKRWKNSLKGLFDISEPHTHWIVTGSAGLNVYRKGQDSLLGRHFTYHLHPFSLAELMGFKPPSSVDRIFVKFQEPGRRANTRLKGLMTYGGFPEPLFKRSRAFLRMWRQTRLDRLLNQDLAQTENLRNLSLVENLMRLLPDRVGSTLSINALRENLEVNFATVKHWLTLLERVFYGYAVRPYTLKKSRLIKKEAKWYLWDWSEVASEAARFENLVAGHLLKAAHYFRDTQGEEVELHFVKDRAQNEVDFLLTHERKPWILVECKLARQVLPKSLIGFSRLLGVKKAFLVCLEEGESARQVIGDTVFHSLSAAEFLQGGV